MSDVAAKRLDIQGLRALAVLLVVVYHLWPSRLTGGYIGVDVFFVISGYLITAHLLSEVDRTGTVSLTRFWARRIRRLLPAAFLVIGASLAIAYFVLPSSVLTQNLSEIGAASIYALNWLLAFNAVDYLAAENAPSLVQHYWSLSVEEQFYIFWPLLILLALAFGKRLRVECRRTVIGVTLAVVFVASLTYSVWMTSSNPGIAYFATPTRAWEFAVGGLLAFAPATFRPDASRATHVILSWASLVAIVGSSYVFDASTAFPGYIALIPVAGTAALIVLGDSANVWSPQYLARHGFVQMLGDTSYAIYLWHWPLIVALPHLTGKPIGLKWGMAILGATVLLSLLTQRFVEEPFRTASGPLGLRRTTYSMMAIGMAAVVGVAAVGASNLQRSYEEAKSGIHTAMHAAEGCYGAYALINDCDNPYSSTSLTNPAFAAVDKDSWGRNDPGEKACIKTYPSHLPARDCTFGEGTTTVAFVGDSHAGHLLEPMKKVAEENGWRLRVYILGGCSTFEDQFTIDGLQNPQTIKNVEACMEWSEHVKQSILDEQPHTVIFSSMSWRRLLDPSTIAASFDEYRSSGITPVVLEDVPGMPNGVTGPACVESKLLPCDTKLKERVDPVLEAARTDGTAIVSLNDVLCDDTNCPPVIGGAIVYTDEHHLSRSFAYTLTPILLERIPAIVRR